MQLGILRGIHHFTVPGGDGSRIGPDQIRNSCCSHGLFGLFARTAIATRAAATLNSLTYQPVTAGSGCSAFALVRRTSAIGLKVWHERALARRLEFSGKIAPAERPKWRAESSQLCPTTTSGSVAIDAISSWGSRPGGPARSPPVPSAQPNSYPGARRSLVSPPRRRPGWHSTASISRYLITRRKSQRLGLTRFLKN